MHLFDGNVIGALNRHEKRRVVSLDGKFDHHALVGRRLFALIPTQIGLLASQFQFATAFWCTGGDGHDAHCDEQVAVQFRLQGGILWLYH